MKGVLARRRGGRTARPPAPEAAWAWFFDIDGTLLHLTETPSETRADHDLIGLISRLARGNQGAVALISGRRISDIDRIFHGHRFPAAGQHGAERRTAAGCLTLAPPPGQIWDRIRTELNALVRRHPGLEVEDKGLSLALHYRRAPALASFAHQFMHLLREELGDRFLVQRGKRVVELKPAGNDKGTAIQAFMCEPPFAGRVPVFLGDDVTDEYGFAVVNSHRGYAIKVGRGRTTAPWRLNGVDAVIEWLSLLDSNHPGSDE